MDPLWIVLASLLTIAGLVGTIMPMIPGGPVLNYAALLVLQFGYSGQWGRGALSGQGDAMFSTTLLVVFGVLTLIAMVLDFALPVLGAKLYKATRYGIVGSMIGTIVGLLVFSIPGMFIGMFGGAVVGELLAGQAARQALRAGAASFIGGVTAMAVKFALAAAMTVAFVASFF